MMPLSSRHRLTPSTQVVTPRALQGLLILTLTLTPRWLRRELSKAFESWVRVREEHSHEQRVGETVRRFALRLLNARLAIGFETWRQAVEDAKAATSKMSRALNRLVHAGVAFAFDRWREAWTSVKEKRRQMMSFVRKMFAGDLARAWATWAAVVEPLQLLRRAARALSQQGVRRAFNSWQEACQVSHEHSRQLEMARKVRLPNCTLALSCPGATPAMPSGSSPLTGLPWAEETPAHNNAHARPTAATLLSSPTELDAPLPRRRRSAVCRISRSRVPSLAGWSGWMSGARCSSACRASRAAGG